jgi:16S rRNA (cytosine967-C5)-methyltransferase
MYYIRQHCSAILSSYTNEVPLAIFLRQYFKKFPILGSRDRKLLSAMAYSYYRCSKGISGKQHTEVEKVDVSLLLCENKTVPINRILDEDFQQLIGLEFNELLKELSKRSIEYSDSQNFAVDVEFSDGITQEQWIHSMLDQPLLFIRISDKYKQKVISQLNKAGISFKQEDEHCLSFANGTSLEKVLKPDSYRVQDLSSQKTAGFFQTEQDEVWWDSCCGAGGKSLLLMEKEPSIKLSVSDTRERILGNLSERFYMYGFKHPEQYLLSASDPVQTLDAFGKTLRFDSIICDVPCSGSGTWARTPEQFYFFNPEKLDEFAEQQFAIASNAVNHLKPGGKLYYITCSVFKKENEDVINLLIDKTELKLERMELINGISQQADSMFVAVLKYK